MSGKTNLEQVLNSMQVSCDNIEYGFATTGSGVEISERGVVGTFQEKEGLTVIATKEYFESKQLPFQGSFAKLTIEVHTSLELVGLTAVFATKLADSKISANVIAGYFHDHIFVQYSLREKALAILNKLRDGGSKS